MHLATAINDGSTACRLSERRAPGSRLTSVFRSYARISGLSKQVNWEGERGGTWRISMSLASVSGTSIDIDISKNEIKISIHTTFYFQTRTWKIDKA